MRIKDVMAKNSVTVDSKTLSFARPISMLLTALLVLSPMGAVQEVLPLALAEADNRGADSALTAEHRILRLLRHGAAFFGIPTTFLIGGFYEQSLAVGDFNNDGVTDLAVAEADSDDIWLLLGDDGTGGFGTPIRLAVDARQRIVGLGDFDGDGFDDQAVADQFVSGVTLLFGDGTGEFSATTDASGSPRVTAVLLGDFDKDGTADLAVLDGVSNQVTILLGDEYGEVRSKSSIPVGEAPTAIAVGDFNGDDIADLVVANSRSGDVSVLFGDGQGSFGVATSFAAGAGPTGVVVGDFNGDGLADLAVANSLVEHISLLLGDGMGGFGAPTSMALDSHLSRDFLAAVDAGKKGSGDESHNVNSSGSSARLDSATYEGIVSLTLNPTTIAGGSGASSTGTVTLNAPAPAGGVVVTLASSNVELAASVPSLTVPASATSATFTVATNAKYRRYSGLAFNVTILAAHGGVTRSATLNITAQARPTEPARNPDTDLRGLNCAGEPGILFDCKDRVQCFFKQECTLGCLTRRSEGTNWRDICATTGPFPISLNPKSVVGGNPLAGTLLLSAPASEGSFGLVSSSLVACPENRGIMPISTGATSLGFNVLTAPVNAIQFAPMDAHITTPEPLSPSGGTFFASRHQRAWLAVVPGTPPPVNLISLSLDFSSVQGGFSIGGRAWIDQLKPAPEIADVPLVITSSNPAVATIFSPFFPQGSNWSTFGVQTTAVAATTTVTITATLGVQTLTAQLTVTATPPATRVTSFFLDPLSVIGGNPVTGTVVLNGLAPAGGAVVTLTSFTPAVVILPANVTVPAGTDRVSFAVQTIAVAASTSVTLSATYGIGPSLNSLTVLPAGPALTLSLHTLSPTSVASGGTSTGTVTLSGTVPAGSVGAVVTLSSGNSAVASVPADVTVPAGASSATYTATAGTVTATSSAAITANFGGTSRTATLTVTPGATTPSLSAVTVNPTSVVGGNSSSGTVTLSAAAPTGGAAVSLSDNSTAAAVPASVTVPAGATSANFTVTTTSVTASTSATISAVFAGVMRTAVLTVTPASGGTLPAPTLVSPANDARFLPGQAITFDWSDVAGAVSYTIQIDDADTFTTPLIASQTMTASQYTNSTLQTIRMWWRARANDSAGNPGAWSAVRRVEVKN